MQSVFQRVCCPGVGTGLRRGAGTWAARVAAPCSTLAQWVGQAHRSPETETGPGARLIDTHRFGGHAQSPHVSEQTTRSTETALPESHSGSPPRGTLQAAELSFLPVLISLQQGQRSREKADQLQQVPTASREGQARVTEYTGASLTAQHCPLPHPCQNRHLLTATPLQPTVSHTLAPGHPEFNLLQANPTANTRPPSSTGCETSS